MSNLLSQLNFSGEREVETPAEAALGGSLTPMRVRPRAHGAERTLGPGETVSRSGLVVWFKPKKIVEPTNRQPRGTEDLGFLFAWSCPAELGLGRVRPLGCLPFGTSTRLDGC